MGVGLKLGITKSRLPCLLTYEYRVNELLDSQGDFQVYTESYTLLKGSYNNQIPTQHRSSPESEALPLVGNVCMTLL